MSDIHPHDLHQLMRTWLLAEDPYGMRGGGGPSGRIEPPMGRPGGPNDLARVQGENAVERALAPGVRAEPTVSGETARAAGTGAVDKEMDKAATEAWRAKMEGRKADRARAGSEGRAAVADAISPAEVRKMIAARAAQPTWSSPGESGAYAGMVGENAVAGVTPPPGPAGWYPPQMTAPAPATENTTGYAPSAQRARHYGPQAVERELDKDPE